MMKPRPAVPAIATVFSVALLPLAPAVPCASVSRSNVPIPVTGEEAIIAYDSRTGTERFIRKATFDTRDRDFGFLVPTPSAPTLSVSSNELFDRLRTIVHTPVLETKTRFVWGMAETEEVPGTTSVGIKTLSASQVVVQQQKRVGDFDATVLKATDAGALLGWLKKHGYVSNPELKEWLEPYVRQGYVITAFRIAADVRVRHSTVGDRDLMGPPPPTETELREWKQELRRNPRTGRAEAPYAAPVHLSPVCLTFKTDTPFYPYREAKNAKEQKGRMLRVYYLGDERVAGQLGDPNEIGSEEWRVTMLQSRVLAEDHKRSVSSADSASLSYQQIGDRLTVFEDRVTLRRRKDLFFMTSPNQAIKVPKQVEYDDINLAPITLLTGSILGGTGVAWWVRRRKK